MKEWVGQAGDSKLSDWDISRDAPYFGFEIPDAPGKYFYVWLDAPIGYYASFLNYCQSKGLNFEEWVRPDTTTEQYHFIGKDILYFHTLFWPATLHFAGYRTPTNVFAHGFLTVDGEKMSKSRGTLISAHSVIESGFNPEWFRYYFATKLNDSMEDLDLNLQDFVARVNSDLLGKYINIASRSAGFLVKRFGGIVSDDAMKNPLLTEITSASEKIAGLYEAREYAKALRTIMELADQVNAFVDENKPWEIAKDPEREADLQRVCSVSLEAFRLLSLYLKPVLPQVAAGVEEFLSVPALSWNDVSTPLSSKNPIQAYKHLMTRVEAPQIEALLAANL
jgi:methionyl-tRNA synthetase